MTDPTLPPVPTLAEFLKRYPWPADWAKLGPTRDYIWTHDLATTPEKLWPYLSDVSSFNKRIGLSQMRFTEKDGKAYGTAKTQAGLLAWEELPWEWEFGRSIAHARVYSKGYFKVFRARYIAEPAGENRLRLTVYFGAIPANAWGKFVAGIFFKGLREKYQKAFDAIIPYMQKREKAPADQVPVVLPPEVHQKIDKARQNLTAGGVPNMVTNRILEFIRSAPEEDLVRIRLKPLAREWSLKERDLLGGFLLATREGLFNLTWDVICPHCRGVRDEIGSLGRLPRRGHCAVCRVDFDATAANALEVTFHANPSIRKVEKRLFCAAEPATKPHIRIQKTLKPGDEISLPTLLSDGRYRMRIQGTMDYNLLDLENQREETNVVWPDTLAQESLKARHFPTVVLRNTAAEAKTFVLEENRQDLDTLRPVDLFTFQGFRDLFSQEALAADLKLEIGVQTILFTDLVGSTQFYEKEGDTVAFTEVRQHFLRTYEAVKAHDGAVVKTIGDAVMAAFVRPLDALKAAVEMQKYFNGHNPATRLRLRITLNTGSCLAVNLNSNIDYFGNTVNLAAKIQAIAGAGQIGFTPAVLEDPEAAAYLKGLGLAVEQVEFETKWSKKTIPLFRVEVK